MRLSVPAEAMLERAVELAAERAHASMRPVHVLLSMVDDPEGLLALCRERLSSRSVRDAVVAELGARAAASPYRSAAPAKPTRDGFEAELARTLPFAKRLGLVETTPLDVRSYVLACPCNAAVVASSRFDPAPIEAFAEGAIVVARRHHREVALAEHGVMYALTVAHVRASLERAGFDVEQMLDKLDATVTWTTSVAPLAAVPALVAFSVLKANVAEVATLGLEPILADLLRREDVRKTFAAIDVDAFDLFSALVHGARIHVDPTSAVASELRFDDDSHTTMEFVVSALREEVGMAEDEARRAMLDVHQGGSTSIGVGKRDARAVAKKIRARARAAGMPLRVELVPL